MADDVLVYPVQPLGTACWIISMTLHCLSTFFDAM